jgi:hypothetical protein
MSRLFSFLIMLTKLESLMKYLPCICIFASYGYIDYDIASCNVTTLVGLIVIIEKDYKKCPRRVSKYFCHEMREQDIEYTRRLKKSKRAKNERTRRKT